MEATGSNSFWDKPLDVILAELKCGKDGLSSDEAAARLKTYGPNILAKTSRFAILGSIFRLFTSPLVLILLVAAGISFGTGDNVNASIIIAIVMLSAVLNFYQEFQASHAVQALRSQVASLATVVRDGKSKQIPVAEVVRGDLVELSAGSLIPADGRLIDANDLYVRESALTGESAPVEKTSDDLQGSGHAIGDAANSVFMGTALQSGVGRAIIVRTGRDTAFGGIAAALAERAPETEFDRGIRRFGYMITRIILLLVVFVFIVNTLAKRPVLESGLFSIALAVGLTPELLPVIVAVTLSRGARRMAAKKVIVKQLASIENFGSMEILCSDKTGTLTDGNIVLDKHVDISGKDDDRVLQLLYVNSFFEAGIKSPLDDAILKHEHPSIDEFKKLEEIPFDFTRRRLSVVVQQAAARTIVTKGSAEDVFAVCTKCMAGESEVPFDEERRKLAQATYEALGSDGYRVLGLAIRSVPEQEDYEKVDERDMTLVGFGAFLDPPKSGATEALDQLKAAGISVVIMTGDNEHVTAKVAKDVGLKYERIFTGPEVSQMTDAALAVHAERGAIFAKVAPEQKNRVITALKARGHVVGFMGDGINDAPSMHTADVGISVANGVDVAKDAASVILMEQDLKVLLDGVLEGRRSFANIMKYITMGTSSNFGNMFSMAVASLVLPFLPMLPTQILVNNFLYDASQVSIPTDNVDPEQFRAPKRWQISFIQKFMVIIGPISSIYDFLTFGALLLLFKANAALFHTGWFVESLTTQTLVIFVIRTTGNPFKSKPAPALVATIVGMTAIAIALPYTPLAHALGFVPLPASLLGLILLLTVTYLGLVQVVKSWFYRRHQLM